MTNNPKKPENPKSRNFKKLQSKKTSKNKLDPDPNTPSPIFDDVLEGLDLSTLPEFNTKKKIKSSRRKKTNCTFTPKKVIPKKNPKKRSKDFFLNCFNSHEKTKNPKNSLTQNLNKKVIPIASKQKTKKSKDSLTQISRKKPLKKSSKHNLGGAGSVLTILS